MPVYGKDFTYTGDYQICDDSDNNWRIKFLTSGTFTPLDNMMIDSFLVGGGGGGSHSIDQGETSGTRGGTSSAFNITAAGGYSASLQQGSGNPYSRRGGNGGSGGGGGHCNGGSDGSDGGSYNTDSSSQRNFGGKGQGTTTREFGEHTGDLYSGGGGGADNTAYSTNAYKGGAGGGGNGEYCTGSGEKISDAQAGVTNTGGGGGGLSSSGNQFPFGCGGGGGYTTTQKSIYLEKNRSYSIIIGDGGTGTKRYTNSVAPSGGSGIVIIRNHKPTSNLIPLSGDLTVGNTVTFDDKDWVVVHNDGNLWYLALSKIPEECRVVSHGSNNTESGYAGSTLETKTVKWETDNLSELALQFCENVTVENVTHKVFSPTYTQVKTTFSHYAAAEANRICTEYINNTDTPCDWWTSSPAGTYYCYEVTKTGKLQQYSKSGSLALRPHICIKYEV